MEYVGSTRYKPALHPSSPTIRLLSYSNCQIYPLYFSVNFHKFRILRVNALLIFQMDFHESMMGGGQLIDKESPVKNNNEYQTAEVSTAQFMILCAPRLTWFNSYSASHDNWCTATLWNRVMTAQCEGMGEVGSVRYEPALLPPCPSIRALCYSNCQRSTQSHQQSKG